MPRASRLRLAPVPPSEEISGERLARIRRERGFAAALEVSTDELLQPGGPKTARKPNRKVLQRLEQIEALPERQQLTLLRTIDTFLENAALKSAAG